MLNSNLVTTLYIAGAEFFGDLGMSFKKKSGQSMGLITVNIKSEDRKLTYIFNERGYELLDDFLELDEAEIE